MNSEQELENFFENCDNDNISKVKKALENHILEDFYEDLGWTITTRSWQLVKNRIKRNKKFMDAIINNDEETVRKYIKSNNIDINYYDNRQDIWKRPILCVADRYIEGFVININILKMLLNSKQKIMQALLPTTLLNSVVLNSFEAVTLLLDHGVDINHTSYDENALTTAIDSKNEDMIKFLIKNGADTSELNSYALSVGIDLESLTSLAEGLLKKNAKKYPSEEQLYRYLEYNVGIGKMLDSGNVDMYVKEYFLETIAEMNHRLIKKFKLNVFENNGSASDIFISKLLCSMDNYFLIDDLLWNGNENLYDIDDVRYRFGSLEEYKMLLLSNKEKIISFKNNFFGDWMEYDKTPPEVTLFTAIVNRTGMSDALRNASTFDGRKGMSCMFNILLSLLELNTLSRYSLTLEGIKVSRNR